MDPDRIAEEIHARMIRQSLLDVDFATQTLPLRRDRRTMMDYQKQLKDTKLKIVATDSMIRKVRAGELDIKELKKEAMASKEKNRRNRREFIKKLELLARFTLPEHSENENYVPPEPFESTEDQMAILILNKKKQTETLSKEARLLMEVIFGKNITREHNDLLQKEYYKNKADRFMM